MSALFRYRQWIPRLLAAAAIFFLAGTEMAVDGDVTQVELETITVLQLVFGAVGFVGSVLILTNRYLSSVFGNQSTTLSVRDPSSNSSSKDNGSDSNINNSEAPKYRKHQRVYVWWQKIFHFLCLFVTVLNFKAFTNSSVPLSSSSSSSFSSSDILYREESDFMKLCALMLVDSTLIMSLYDDDVNSIGDKTKKGRWLCIHTLILAYAILSFVTVLQHQAVGRAAALPASIWVLIFAALAIGFSVVEYTNNRFIHQFNNPPYEYTCDIWDFISFCHVNFLMDEAVSKGKLDITDVPGICDKDSCRSVWRILSYHMEKCKSRRRHRSVNNRNNLLSYGDLVYSLYKVVQWEFITQGCFQLMTCICGYISPLALLRILKYLGKGSDGSSIQDQETLNSQNPSSIEYYISLNTAVLFLFIGPVLKGIGDSQVFMRGRHIGVQLKSAIISACYQKALVTNLSATKNDIGSLSNLISVDASGVQEFMCYSHFLWGSILEMSICISLLFLVLGPAALGGLVIMLFACHFAYRIGLRLKKYQKMMLKAKDYRMTVITEILNSIRVIKMFSWEDSYLDKLFDSRATELDRLKRFNIQGQLQNAMWETLPIFVAIGAFIVQTHVLKRPLTSSVGFTSLTLFNLLRGPMQWLPDQINALIFANVSLTRIHKFLQSPEVSGLPAPKHNKDKGASLSGDFGGKIRKARSIGQFNPSLMSSKYGEIEVAAASFTWPVVKKENDENEGGLHGSEFRLDDNGNVCGCSVECMKSVTDTVYPILVKIPPCISFYAKRSIACMDFYWQKLFSSQSRYSPLLDASLHPKSSSEACNGTGDNVMSALEGSKNEKLLPTTSNLIKNHPDEVELSMSTLPSCDDQKGVYNRQKSTSGVVDIERGNSSYDDDDDDDDDDLDCDVDILNNDVDAHEPLERIILHDVHLKIHQGELTVIVGMTGTGKSSLLAGILGESNIISGSVGIGINSDTSGTKNEGVSYAAQSAWIQNATLRDNVLFGTPFDEDRYTAVLSACALDVDIAGMKGGDLTEIGEKGINLSGGQQQRINIARAAYSKSPIIVLDDVLSAVDPHVADHLMTHLINGFLNRPDERRTRILVSHQLALTIPYADKVIVVGHDDNRECRVVVNGVAPSELQHLLKNHTTKITTKTKEFYDILMEISGRCSSNVNKTDVVHPSNADSSINKSPSLLGLQNGAPSSPIRQNSNSMNSLEAAAAAAATDAANSASVDGSAQATGSGSNKKNSVSLLATTPAKQMVLQETMATGEVTKEEFMFYINNCGGKAAAILVFVLLVLSNLTWFLQNYYLAIWMKDMERVSSWRGGTTTLSIYLFFCFACTAIYLLQCFMEIVLLMRGATNTHSSLSERVVMAKTVWYDVTPIGRIINRFSQDIMIVDRYCMNTLMRFLEITLFIIQILAVIIVSIPFLLVLMVPIVFCTRHIALRYVQTSRELKRLESIFKSPVFVIFSESLHGLPIIRSFEAEERFFNELCHRVDNMSRCHVYLWCTNRWLNLRMQVLGGVVAGSVGLAILLFDSTHGNYVSSTAAGLSLVYALTFTDNLTWFARTYADNQLNMNAIERIREFCEVESEAYLGDDKYSSSLPIQKQQRAASIYEILYELYQLCVDKKEMSKTVDDPSLCSKITVPSASALQRLVPFAWPTQGAIEFKNVNLVYRTIVSSPAQVLNDVTFDLKGGSKVGIVGRTGSGKSSLITALFRMTEPERDGDNSFIKIDGVNIFNLPLNALRSCIGIVPQDPLLFRGSIRSNLDPFEKEDDAVLWSALEKVHMDDAVRALPDADSDDDTNSAPDRITPNKANTVQHADERYPNLRLKLVSEKGGNLSVGQRQLLCMARAIIKGSKILVMDEATASCDAHTDALIQDTLHAAFGNSTVLTIAHRLHTIVGCDKVLVMDAGRVAEQGSPSQLMQIEGGKFRGMCERSGDIERLRELMQQ